MLTETEAQECAEETAAKFEQLPYEELLKLARAPSAQHEALHGFEHRPQGDPYVSVTVAELGWWRRKRVSVEVVVTDEGWENWSNPGCVYFERWPSGRLWRPQASRIEIMIVIVAFWLLVLLSLALVAIRMVWTK